MSAEQGGHGPLEDNRILRILLAVIIVWLAELFVNFFLRNTVPRVSATKYNLFHGLLEPVVSLYGLRDFTVDYNWDNVRPLIPYNTVTVPFGSIHDSARMIFQMNPPHSYYNFWGLMTIDEEREADWFCRSMNICALHLPVSMRWIAKEAWGVKEDVLVTHFLSGFKDPVCYFCLWLLDWPMHYVDEPQQAGLIFSHILCKDVISISKMVNKTQQARLAQLCVHQWHGLLCCILVHTIKQTVEQRNESSNAIKSFIHRTLTRFGKRSAREIQATWKTRQMHMEEMEISNLQKRNIEVVKDVPQQDDANESARGLFTNGPISLVRNLWQNVLPKFEKNRIDSSSHPVESDSDSLLNVDYLEDQLLFNNFVDVESEGNLAGGGDDKNSKTCIELGPPREMPVYSVLREDDGGRETMEVALKTRKKNKPIRSKSTDTSIDETELTEVKSDSVSVDLNVNYSAIDDGDKEKTSNSNIEIEYSNNSSQDTIVNPTDAFDVGKNTPLGHVNLGYVKRDVEKVDQAHAEMNTNINAKGSVESVDSDDDGSDSQDLIKKKRKANDVDIGKKTEEEATKEEKMEDKKKQQEASKSDSDDKERMRMIISEIEAVSLGPPHDASFAKERDKKYPSFFMRHKNEYLGYCCQNKRCQAFADIHKKVGHTSLEVLKKILIDLLFFAMDSRELTLRSKMWLRKKMVLKMFESMEKKAAFYDNYMFQGNKGLENTGFMVNQLLSTIFTILKVLLKMSLVNREEAKYGELKARKLLYEIAPRKVSRCLFCAKKLKNQRNYIDIGCDKMEKLVSFFVKDTISVAEKEINLEFEYKVSLQRYCAMNMNIAKREVQVELEDPPMVLATKVTRAMLYKELDDLVPKHTDFKDMTADELRRVGTRRERIQARHDPLAGSTKKESLAQKKRKRMIQVIESAQKASDLRRSYQRHVP